ADRAALVQQRRRAEVRPQGRQCLAARHFLMYSGPYGILRVRTLLMRTPIYRLGVPADAYEIAVMSRYLIEVGLRGWSCPPDRVAKAIRARDTNVLVADVKQHLVGFAIMEFGETAGHLSLFAVKPSH